MTNPTTPAGAGSRRGSAAAVTIELSPQSQGTTDAPANGNVRLLGSGDTSSTPVAAHRPGPPAADHLQRPVRHNAEITVGDFENGTLRLRPDQRDVLDREFRFLGLSDGQRRCAMFGLGTVSALAGAMCVVTAVDSGHDYFDDGGASPFAAAISGVAGIGFGILAWLMREPVVTFHTRPARPPAGV